MLISWFQELVFSIILGMATKNVHAFSLRRERDGKSRAGKSCLVLILHLIGKRKWSAIFRPITEGSKEETKANEGYFRHSTKTALRYHY